MMFSVRAILGWISSEQNSSSCLQARRPVPYSDIGSCSGVAEQCMTSDEERELRALLERLRQEHRDLDAAISALMAVTGSDILQIQRLKKRKLQLKDRISHLEDELFPDIIA